MSHTTRAIKNKQQKELSTYSQQYLFDPNEPWDDVFGDSPAEIEAELLENSPLMRRRFRYIAQKMRNR